jgi:hypothetical protein
VPSQTIAFKPGHEGWSGGDRDFDGNADVEHRVELAVSTDHTELMVRFDELNTRLKDYFDLYVLATEVVIDDASLTRQLAHTFQRRGTTIPGEMPVGLSDAFASDSERNARWRAFLERSAGAASAPASFPEVVNRIRELVLAPPEAARGGA